MGKVSKARELSLDRVVAVKVTRAHLDTPAGRAFFEGEARSAARLDHPHIVKFFSFQPDHVPPYYVMQYVKGRPLEHACRGRGGRDWQLIAGLFEKVARAIDYAHGSGIVHRDIKPANILVDYEDEPHVTDFGLAKRIDDLLEKPTGEFEESCRTSVPPQQCHDGPGRPLEVDATGIRLKASRLSKADPAISDQPA